MKTLVVAVHPDDETLACGGTLLKHRTAGHEQHWAIVTTSAAGHPATVGRTARIAQVAEAFGFTGVHDCQFPTTRLDTVPMGDLVEAIAGIFNTVRPEVVYLPFSNDVHSDHRVMSAAALSCTKSFRFPFLRRILMMETISETDFASPLLGAVFAPNVLVDVSAHFEEKLHIAEIYRDELGTHPFPRSLEDLKALAMLRGAMAGCRYAEGFMLAREIS